MPTRNQARRVDEARARSRRPALERGSAPIYEQIRRSILTDIWRRIYRPGDLLPSESDLSARFGVNRLTVRQAVHLLVNQGFVRALHGRGYQVTSSTLSADFLTSASLSHYMQELGIEVASKLLSATIERPTADITDALGLTAGDEVIRIVRLRTVLEDVVAVDEAYYDAARYARLLELDLDSRSLLEILYRVFQVRVARITTELTAEQAGERAHLLGVSPADPLLVARAVMYSFADDPIEYGLVYYHSDRFRLTFNAPIDPHSWPYDSFPDAAPSP